MQDLSLLSVSDIADGLRQRKFVSVELVQACLAKIERLDGIYKAFITIADDALAQAEAADATIARGEGTMLTGVPVSIKDLTVTAGLRTTYGSSLFSDYVPREDELVAARVRAAGAVIIGKTNTPEFGYGAITDNKLQGPTANPFDRERTSGGSSGGSAVAVSLGMSTTAIGSDFGGSVRMPASFCGIFGFRPAIGTIPTAPKTHAWQGLMTNGTFGRSARDAALFAAVLAGPDPRDPLSLCQPSFALPEFDRLPARKPRIAASVNLAMAEIDKTVADVFRAAVDRLRNLYDVTDVAPPMAPQLQDAYETLRGALLHDQFKELVERHGEAVSPTLRWNASRGEGITGARIMWAERVRTANLNALLNFFDSYDFVVTVAAPVYPFLNADREVLAINGKPLRNIIDYAAISLIGTMTGFPCISVPCGMTPQGLPIGMQIVAPSQRQQDLLAMAHRLEVEAGFTYVRPPDA